MGMVWLMRTASDDDVAMLRQDPTAVADFIDSEQGLEGGTTFDVEKQWHAIHFLLTGSADPTDSPLSLILGEFEEIGPDHGYGPAWFIPGAFIQRFNEALSATNDAELAARYDTAAMLRDEVYIAGALDAEGEEGLEFLMEDVARLRVFAAKAAGDGLSAFAFIT